MKKLVDRVVGRILMTIFIWSGTRLFPFVDLYNPGTEEDPIQGMAFCADEETWERMRRET